MVSGRIYHDRGHFFGPWGYSNVSPRPMQEGEANADG